MKVIDPFSNVSDSQVQGTMYGSELNNIDTLQAGTGDKVMRADSQGLWLGASEFADAPFKVDMDGNVVMASGSISGYVAIGGSASDVNSGATTISGSKITAGSITASQIAANTITANEIAGETITASQLAAGSVDTDALQANCVTAGKILAGSVTATKIDVSSLSAISANIGSITTGTLTGVTITGSTVQTASSGKRVVLSTSNYIDFYNSSGTNIGRIEESGNNLYISGRNGQNIYIDGGGNVQIQGSDIYMSLDSGGYWEVTGILACDKDDSYISFDKTVRASSGDFIVSDDMNVQGNLKSNHHDPRSNNTYNQGSDDTYWNYIYADDFINKSIGWYDDGVTLIDGRKVSDLEGLLNIKPHPTLKNKNGSPKLDARTLPVEMLRPAFDRDSDKFYPRDENNVPYSPEVKDKKGKIIKEYRQLTDGESLTHFVSIMFGAMKEINTNMEEIKAKIEQLESSIKE